MARAVSQGSSRAGGCVAGGGRPTAEGGRAPDRPLAGQAARGSGVQWYQNVFELIDMRSFSNVWYWIALAVLWSSLSHFVLGVPYDLVTRARRRGGKAMVDLEDLVRVNVNRRLYVAEVSGPLLVAFVAGALTVLGLLGFLYRIQFGQALFLLLAPAALVGLIGVRAARRLADAPLAGEDLCRFLARHRVKVQVIGIFAVLVTSMWGMWQNMSMTALGG